MTGSVALAMYAENVKKKVIETAPTDTKSIIIEFYKLNDLIWREALTLLLTCVCAILGVLLIEVVLSDHILLKQILDLGHLEYSNSNVSLISLLFFLEIFIIVSISILIIWTIVCRPRVRRLHITMKKMAESETGAQAFRHIIKNDRMSSGSLAKKILRH